MKKAVVNEFISTMREVTPKGVILLIFLWIYCA